ncbi:hypothetical protein [Streptomyces iconiensis]|uniref:Secreted protein n=1 Tax=Streptomyces iconiensis TaxID=1384038 RepID=A0ABT6ZMX7_9ACTN|nr:hypothetical protein [Streptomyces iconiensis]MDJ1130403.1 hypothetical protein [Streptomyces iconiensis]
MDVGLVIGLVLFLAFVTLGAMVTVRAVRTVKRGVERTGAQVRRTVEETTLKARGVQPGPVGEVARVRLELRSSFDSTRRVLETGAQDDPALREALSLLDRLHDHARHLDGELRMLMEGEPDRARVSASLPDARDRMRRLKESADSLRFAAQDRARQFDHDGLDSLREQIEIETGALRHWTSGSPVSDPLASGAPAADPSAADALSGEQQRRGGLGRTGKTGPARSEEPRGALPEASRTAFSKESAPAREEPVAEPKRSGSGIDERRPRGAS